MCVIVIWVWVWNCFWVWARIETRASILCFFGWSGYMRAIEATAINEWHFYTESVSIKSGNKFSCWQKQLRRATTTEKKLLISSEAGIGFKNSTKQNKHCNERNLFWICVMDRMTGTVFCYHLVYAWRAVFHASDFVINRDMKKPLWKVERERERGIESVHIRLWLFHSMWFNALVLVCLSSAVLNLTTFPIWILGIFCRNCIHLKRLNKNNDLNTIRVCYGTCVITENGL